jgi:hypothetical protein
MSSGMIREPMKPVAPVTNTRMSERHCRLALWLRNILGILDGMGRGSVCFQRIPFHHVSQVISRL